MYVFDILAKSPNGRLAHFNLVLPENDSERALRYAREWLRRVGLEAEVTPGNCFCSHEGAEPPAAMREEIRRFGYAVESLEGCPVEANGSTGG